MATANFDSSFKEQCISLHRILWVVGSVCFVVFKVLPCVGQPLPAQNYPRVLMISNPDVDSQDDGLYTAVRAQLSAAPIVLERIATGYDTTPMTEARAERLASTEGAAMVFWIEIDETCRLNFYVPDAKGGHITRRVVDLNLSSRSSRFDVMAVVASSVIEGLLVSKTLRVPEAVPPPDVLPSVIVKRDGLTVSRVQFEIVAAYTGALVMTNAFSHGFTFGIAVLSRHRLAVEASFTQNLRQRFDADTLSLDILSRQLEMLAAGRLVIRPVDVRLGVAWSMDFRSYQSSAATDAIDPRRDGLVTVHSLIPFVSVSWLFHERFGLFGRLGASVALNETSYKIGIPPDGEATVFEPFALKLSYRFGLLIRL